MDTYTTPCNLAVIFNAAGGAAAVASMFGIEKPREVLALSRPPGHQCQHTKSNGLLYFD